MAGRAIGILAMLAVQMSLGCGAIAARAEEPTPGDFVLPFVDNQTLAIVHIDLAAFRVADAVDVLAEFLHLSDERRDWAQAQLVPINVFADTLPEGARADVFVVISLADLAMPFFVVVPREENPASAAIAMEIRRALDRQFEKADVQLSEIGSALVTGSARTIERLKKAKPTERAEVAAAFAATGEAAVRLLVVPSVDARRAIELLYPKLPEALGGGPTSRLTQTTEWLAVGISLEEGETHIRLNVQATSDENAAALATAVAAVIAPLGKRPELADTVPDAEELAKRLVPTASGNRLSLELSIPNDELANYGTLLSPFLKLAAAAAPK